MMTLHGTTERIREQIKESEECIIQDEECIECLESRISDKHIDIIWNRGRIDLAEELIEMIGIKEIPVGKEQNPVARDIKYDITKFPFPQYAGLVPEGNSYDDVYNAIMNGKPTHPGNTVSYGVSGDDPSTIKFITQSINDPNVVNVSIAKSDDDDTLFRIDVLRGIEGIVTGFHISVKRSDDIRSE